MVFVLLATVLVAIALLVILAKTRQGAAQAASDAAGEQATLTARLTATEQQLAAVKTEQLATKDELSDQVTLVQETQESLAKSEDRAHGLQVIADELSETEQQSAQRIAVLEIDVERLREGMSQIEPQTLWELELQRSERTWRYNVSVAPDFDESPFVDTADPLRLAVEIEAAALKEEAGAFLSVDWQAAPVEDPARAHLILRLAQEMLAAASRERLPACLYVSGTGAVTLTMEPSEAEDQHLQLDLQAPAVSGQLIVIDTEHQAKITVSYA